MYWGNEAVDFSPEGDEGVWGWGRLGKEGEGGEKTSTVEHISLLPAKTAVPNCIGFGHTLNKLHSPSPT